jgi:hypothetical protein
MTRRGEVFAVGESEVCAVAQVKFSHSESEVFAVGESEEDNNNGNKKNEP